MSTRIVKKEPCGCGKCISCEFGDGTKRTVTTITEGDLVKQLRADLDQCRQLLVAAWTLQTPSEANAEIWNRICTFLIAKGWVGSGEQF